MIRHHADNLESEVRKFKETQGNDTLKSENDTLNDTKKLSNAERRILSVIEKNADITIDGIIERTGFSRSTINRGIRSLKEKQLLWRIGSKKSGRWKV